MQRAGHGRLYYAVLDWISAELCKGCQIEEHGFVPPDCQLRKQQRRRRRRLDSTWVTHLTEEDSSRRRYANTLQKTFTFARFVRLSFSVRIFVALWEKQKKGEKKEYKRQRGKAGKRKKTLPFVGCQLVCCLI